MNDRERNLSTLLFGNPDRIPLRPGGGRESTIAAWLTQGLPESEKKNSAECAYRQAGGKLPWPAAPSAAFPLKHRMMPEFEEKILEEKENSRIVQDWKGNICEIDKKYTPKYLNSASDFCTRRWIKCPVESRKDWDDMKKRYDAGDARRLPAAAAEIGRRMEARDWYAEISFPGPFWQLREWVGFEGLCVLFYDDPALARDMISFWEDFISRLLRQIFQHYRPDGVHISEDMAYKSFSMISPAMVREFLLPTWRRWGEIIRGAGVPVYACDSDGFIGELIPIWIEAGINVCDPIEVAAGNDINAFRKQFGRSMAYRGGVDKRAMAKGGRVIDAELERITPVIRNGGCIPSCDHGVPSDVSWPNFVYYTGCLARLTGWM